MMNGIAIYRRILFFDREFVDKNVHLGHRRDTTQNGQEQESGKMIIEFDSDAINLREIRDKAKLARDEQNQKIIDFNSINKDYLNFKLSDETKKLYEIYKNKSEAEITTLIQDLSSEIKEIERNFDTDTTLQKKVSDIQSDINNLPSESFNLTLSSEEAYQGVFDFDLKEQTRIESAQSLVEKIKTHKSFFDMGFEIRKSHREECPFCQSKDKEEEIRNIIDLYEKIYDTTYKTQLQQFESDKQRLIIELSYIINKLDEFDLSKIFRELKRLQQNYKILDIYFVEDENVYKKPYIVELKKLCEKITKLEKPTKETVKELYNKIKIEYDLVNTFFKDIRSYIDEKNILISKFKMENTDEKLKSRISTNNSSISNINNKLTFLASTKIVEQKQKDDKEKDLKVLQEQLQTLRTTFDTALKEYEEYCSTKAFLNLLSKIQDYFKNFNFSFKLKLKTEPTGNKTEFPFAFKILDFEGNEREFKEGLSEGEIQVLSLCFFFAFLDIQKDKINKILIFDDPITSLDNSNLSCLVDLIANEQKNFSQTFVLTHHRTFFKFLRNRFYKHCQEYNLIRNKQEFGGSFICKSKEDKFLDKLKNFEADLARIPPESLDIELKVVEYGQYLRYEIERYIKNNLLHWNANDFSTAIEGVKCNKAIDDADLDKIKQIYSFCNWTTSHVDVNDDHGFEQLKGKIADFVAIVNH